LFPKLLGMTHQTSFSQAEFADKKKIARREKFLARMEAISPWPRLLAVLEPFYPKGERGRPPVGLERMLRMYFLQQNGMAWPTKPSKTPSTTARPCAASPAST
jgi:hypothetical protein